MLESPFSSKGQTFDPVISPRSSSSQSCIPFLGIIEGLPKREEMYIGLFSALEAAVVRVSLGQQQPLELLWRRARDKRCWEEETSQEP